MFIWSNGGEALSINRKQLIIDAATKSFSLFGYKATTMDQVARLANVGKGTIYTFFKNKEELFDEIITTLIKEMREVADQSYDPSLSFHQNAHRVLYNILEFRIKHQLTIKLFQEEREIGTPAVMQVMKKMEQAVLGFMVERIKDAVEKGKIRPCNPEITAFVMVKLYIALIFDWETHHHPLKKEEIAELFELYLFTGLSPK